MILTPKWELRAVEMLVLIGALFRQISDFVLVVCIKFKLIVLSLLYIVNLQAVNCEAFRSQP